MLDDAIALASTHNLSIQIVFLDHDSVHRLCIPEGQEAEPSRPTSSAIAHDSALHDLSEL